MSNLCFNGAQTAFKPLINLNPTWGTPGAGWLPPVPSQTTLMSVTPRILSVKYGDGYESTMPDGINNQPLSFDLVFTNRRTEIIQALDQFFTGTLPFFDRQPHEYFFMLLPAPYAYKNTDTIRGLKWRHGKSTTEFNQATGYTYKISIVQAYDP